MTVSSSTNPEVTCKLTLNNPAIDLTPLPLSHVSSRFARKAPTVVSAEEIAQVFHEIGNCFLALGHLDYARDCGKKALRAAEDADIHYFKFQSWVLIAVSECKW